MELLDLVNDTQLPVRFSAKYTRHHRRGREEKWEEQRLLGRGSFGSVWLQKCWPDGDGGGCNLRAVKRIPKKLPRHSESINYTHELLAIAKFSQPKYEDFFIRSFGWYENAEYVFIAMEYIEYGDLGDHLGQWLPENEVQLITGQLLQGLAHMHTNGFTHRDLKPNNIFVVSKGPYWWIKIGDFGVSKRVQGSTALQTVVGTPGYIAPEIRGILLDFGDGANFAYTSAVDMWSLGIIVCHLLTGLGPSGDNRQLLGYIKNPTKCPPKDLFSNGLEQEAHGFLSGLLDGKPDNRLSARDALQHGWLKKFGEQVPNPPFSRNPQDRSKIDMTSDQDSGLSADEQPSPTLNSAESFWASARWSDLGDTVLSSTASKSHLSDMAEYDIVNPKSGNQYSTNTTEQGLGTIRAIYESGRVLQTQEKFKEAGTKFQQAVELAGKDLGPDHQETLVFTFWLARSLYSQGKYREARARFRQAVNRQENVLGRDHEDTLSSIHWLGNVLYSQQKFSEAKVKFQEAVEGREKVLGHYHEKTLFSIHRLAHSLYCLQEYGEAETRFQEAAKGRATVLGHDHKNTLSSVHWFALPLYHQQKYEEAEISFQQAVKGREKALGHNNQETLLSIYWLARSLYSQQKYRAAESRFREAARAQNQLLGPSHPEAQASLKWFGRASARRTREDLGKTKQRRRLSTLFGN